MSLAAFSAESANMTWIAVGNVEGVLAHSGTETTSHETIPLRGGVVGFRLPLLRAAVVPLRRGDVLVLATDGIDPGFEATLDLEASPQRIADGILRAFGRGTDDALVLVARYLGDDRSSGGEAAGAVTGGTI
jgi:negative regulator of sigma-B (phosphoserine phosphatase)